MGPPCLLQYPGAGPATPSPMKGGADSAQHDSNDPPPPPMLSWAMNTTMDPSYSISMDADMALVSSLGLNTIMTQVTDRTGHLDQHGPVGNSTAPGHQQGTRWLPKPWAFAEPSVATGARKTTSDPGLHKATDPDMALSSCLCLDVSTAQGGSTS